ncbi:MAG: hypothetical protein MZV70_52415 [Desulfobacterales bacterium]|nr:hypothetical protein [Desulfobacterales bacterium]
MRDSRSSSSKGFVIIPEGTYESINFENNKAIDELKGKFKVEEDTLLFYDNQQRLFTTDGKWTPKEQSTMEIRRIKKG